ncbi:hypothetical protein NOF04DRAFT_1173463 [Fusarium oxysporum II5]|uniref:Rhodopsin domain-containing protein n=1 Tax=Fusarium redolens TaxID=48865 RepID=A0A9P9JR87_FUSRE|nr:uncharacterized protein BKA55DRAFT_598176 [Fusarium redolens]KAH7234013.1 hypothetical protein BKA55DRAFT_598176 [Fusarium redolens]KAK2122172.1 hypothetical protein NOF04DRAFT_1350686 [Fusarium oxysporum II5]KAK2134118.1 hypothetical protein NOF04DRAFT_1176088 [Fusarium oxysporum II5]KAK2134120.1 hypothetical protein NOF04DRAFT_1173463 [Fusarium oxysporum II5]
MNLAHAYETPTDKSRLIQTVSLALMMISIFSVLIRSTGRVMSDAGVLMIPQSIVVSLFEAANGLGKPYDVTPSEASHALQATLSKAQYASDILFIASLSASKLSAIAMIRSLEDRSRETRTCVMISIILTLIWAVFSILGRSFSCPLPRFWDYIDGQCDRNTVIALRIGADALHIATDLLVTGVFLRIFMRLQMALRPKLEIIGLFLCRILSLLPATCHIYYYKRAMNSENPLFDIWISVVLVQIMQCVGITITCIPLLKQLLRKLKHGKTVGDGHVGSRSSGHHPQSTDSLGYDLQAPGHAPVGDHVTSSQEALV